MDGLDTYIDDYSVFVPLDAEEARGLVQARAILDPPRTRVNDQGHVEVVPPDEPAAGVPAAADAANEPASADVPAARDADRDGAGTPVAASANPASVAAASPGADAGAGSRSGTRAGRSRTLGRAVARPHRLRVPPDEPHRQETAPLLLQRHHAASRPSASRRPSTCLKFRRCGRCSARRSLAASPRRATATSSSRAPRKRGCSGTSPRRAGARRRSASSTSARRGAGRPRRRRRRRRSPRCWRWPVCPTPIPFRASATGPKGAR